MSRKNTGFTIVELLIVIVVIAILASISIVAYTGIQSRARDTQRRSDIASFTKALELYYLENGEYPSITAPASTINPSWATTADSSWGVLLSQLKPFATGLGSDPVKNPGVNILTNPTTSYNYAYFSNNNGVYCGSAKNQMYILVYRLENNAQVNTTNGDCSTDAIGYYGSLSNYRSVRK